MQFNIETTKELYFLNEISDSQIYLNKILNKNQIKERFEKSLLLNSVIYVVRKENKITCFFTYRKMKVLPAWLLSNLFIIDHNYYSPNTLGFGYAMDQAVLRGENENLFSFLWVCEKKTFKQRYNIGLKDLNKRDSILKSYNFHIFHDSDLHEDYKVFDFLNGYNNIPTYTIMASKNIDFKL